MRRVVAHYRVCKQKDNGSCGVCKQLLALCCYHAKQCKAVACSVPFCHGIRQNLQRMRVQESASLQRRVAQMRATLDTSSKSIDKRQSSKVRFEGANSVGKAEGMGNIFKHNTIKGVHFKAHEMGPESSAHLKEVYEGEAENQQQHRPSFVKSTQREVLRGKAEKEELGESNSSGKLAKSFLQLLQSCDSPQDQRQKVMGVFQSHPKLFKDYLRSREPCYLPAPVQHKDFQRGVKVVPLPWKGEGLLPSNSIEMQQQQMRSQQPVWLRQHQQLVGGKLKLLPASLVKQHEGDELLMPATLQQQQHHVVGGGGQLEINQCHSEAESQKPFQHVL